MPKDRLYQDINIDRNRILEIIEDGPIFDSWFHLKIEIEQMYGSPYKEIIPNAKIRQMNIKKWVLKHLDEIAPF